MSKDWPKNLWNTAASLSATLLFTGLLPMSNLESAQANPLGPKYLTGVELSDPQDYANFFPAFSPEIRDYYINIEYPYFATGDLELELSFEPDTRVMQIFSLSCIIEPLQTLELTQSRTITFEQSDFTSSCGGGSPAPEGTATLFLDLYSQSDIDNGLQYPPYSHYEFHFVYRQIGDLAYNYEFREIPDTGGYGNIVVNGYRGWYVVPNSSPQSKAGYVFGGFIDQDTDQIYLPGQAVLLNRNISAVVNWIPDIPNGSLNLEGTTHSFGVSGTTYLALSARASLNYSVQSTGEYVISVANLAGQTISSYSSNQDLSVSGTVGTATSLPLSEPCPNSNPAVCNVYELSLTIYSPSGTDSTTDTYQIMRRTSQSQPCIEYESNSFLDGPISSCLDAQDWVQVDIGELDPNFTSTITTEYGNYFLHKYQVSNSDEVLDPGAYYPVFQDTTFIADWEDSDRALPQSMTVFGNQLDIVECPDEELDFCLQEAGGQQRLIQPVFDAYANESQYFLDMEFLPTNPLASIESQSFPMSISMAAGSDGEWLISSECCEPGIEFQDLQLLEEDPAFAYQASEFCNFSSCAEIFSIYLNFASYSENYGSQFRLIVLRTYSSDTTIHTLEFNPNGSVTGSQPASISGTRSWVRIPEVTSFSKPGFRSVGWSSDEEWNPSGPNPEAYGGLMYPLMGSLQLYNAWLQHVSVRFYALDSSSPHHEFGQFIGSLDEGEFLNMPNPSDPQGRQFLGWADNPSSSETISPETLIFSDTDFYAIWEPLTNSPSVAPIVVTPTSPPPSSPAPTNPTTQPGIPTSSPEVDEEISLPVQPKTTWKISRLKFVTYVAITLPAKYAGKVATFELKKIINGKVQYLTLSTRTTKSLVNPQGQPISGVLFSFRTPVNPTETIRIRVAGVEVMKRLASS